MKRLLTPILLTALLLASSCSGEKEDTTDVHFHRYEQLLFGTPAKQLQGTLVRDSALYNIPPLLSCYPDNPNYMELLYDFVGDPAIRYIYHMTDSLYRDLSWLERDLGKALAKAHELSPDIVYNHFYTWIYDDFHNYMQHAIRHKDNPNEYQQRVVCYNQNLRLSLHFYALGAMDGNPFQQPEYIVNLCSREHILPDCMTAVAIDHIALPEGDLSFLDHAIYRGKILYFLDQTLPDVPEHIKLRYTPEQLDWMKQNVENVWGYLIQNEVLFNTDEDLLQKVIGEAPKTNAFGDGSAPRVCDYIGWQIVKSYMSHHKEVTLGQLFANTDSRQILNLSQWQPGEEESSSSHLLLWFLVGLGAVAMGTIFWFLIKKKK